MTKRNTKKRPSKQASYEMLADLILQYMKDNHTHTSHQGKLNIVRMATTLVNEMLEQALENSTDSLD